MLILEGGAVALLGVLVGRILPNRRRAPKPPKPLPPPMPVCGCGHHFSFHAPATGACKGTDRKRKYSGGGSDLGLHDFPCCCQTYAGPQPLPEFFAQEIGG